MFVAHLYIFRGDPSVWKSRYYPLGLVVPCRYSPVHHLPVKMLGDLLMEPGS